MANEPNQTTTEIAQRVSTLSRGQRRDAVEAWERITQGACLAGELSSDRELVRLTLEGVDLDADEACGE